MGTTWRVVRSDTIRSLGHDELAGSGDQGGTIQDAKTGVVRVGDSLEGGRRPTGPDWDGSQGMEHEYSHAGCNKKYPPALEMQRWDGYF